MTTSHWAWGPEPDEAELRRIARLFSEHTGLGDPAAWEPPVPFSPALVPAPRLAAPPLPYCTADPSERAVRTYGRAYRDLIRAYRGDFTHAPDVVALPGDEDEIERVLEWATGQRVAVVPRGGGTSVVGGVEATLTPTPNPSARP